MKQLFLALSVLSLLAFPVAVSADAGHADGTAHGITQGVTHIHDDGTVEVHSSSAFALSTPWSSRWWMLIGISLICMGLLSMRVEKYLQVK